MSSFLAVFTLFSANCWSVELKSLIIQAKDIHPLLETQQLSRESIRHISFDVLHDNPQYSEDIKFVNAIARSSSQGKLNGKNIRSALYALYNAGKDLGFYGLDTKNNRDAEQLEIKLRKIWSHNISIGRANVYRKGTVLVVIWHDGATKDVWKAINTKVLNTLGKANPLNG